MGEPPVQLGQLFQHVHQQAEAGSFLQVESPACRQDLLQRALWSVCVGIWEGVRVQMDRTLHKGSCEVPKCPTMGTESWEVSSSEVPPTFQVKTNLPVSLPPQLARP